MKQTNFRFFKNTPLIDFQNTIHFDTNAERDAFFLEGGHYPELNVKDMDFNFVRDRSTIVLPVSYDDMRGVNYCTFKSDFEQTRYYAYVLNYEYLNPNAVRVYLLVDGIMTFTQGNMLHFMPNLTVTRRHLRRGEYNNRLWELKNNDDVLKTSSKHYFFEKNYNFDDFDIIIQSTADLTANFGTVDNPIIESSDGLTYDEISSPVNLYHVKQRDFKPLMKLLAPYPWITQNFISISMIPSIFINETYLQQVEMKDITFTKLNRFIDGGRSNRFKFDDDIALWNYSMSDLYSLFKLRDEDRHLLRNEYATSEIYTWDGQSLLIDMGLLNEDTGIEFRSLVVTGFRNEIGVYLHNYKVKDKGSNDREGSFLNDSIYFRNFDDIPILIDNYTLALSKTANQRELTESKLLSNRVSNVMDSGADLKDRFMNAASLVSNISPTNLFGKFTDEHDYYKQQQAEMKDLALGDNTITNQSTDNALKRSENFYGITIKHARPTDHELEKLKKYYNLFGFMVNDDNSNVVVNSHTICNYVQFSGSWSLPNVDVAIIEGMKAQFENGVRFWHNNNTPNPMTQNVLDNTWR